MNKDNIRPIESLLLSVLLEIRFNDLKRSAGWSFNREVIK